MGELYADQHMRGTMSALTAFGLLLDLMGAVFIAISDPLRFPSLILIVRYWLDRNFPPVSFVKEGYRQVRVGAVYISQEKRLSEEVDPDPDTPQEALNNVNRLERTEVNPELVKRLSQIARLTKAEGRLLADEYRPSSYLNSNLILYKVTYTTRGGLDFEGEGISFVYEKTGVTKKLHGDEDFVYSISEEDFRDKLLEYINGVYLRAGLYLLIAGFSLQIFDILMTEIAGRL